MQRVFLCVIRRTIVQVEIEIFLTPVAAVETGADRRDEARPRIGIVAKRAVKTLFRFAPARTARGLDVQLRVGVGNVGRCVNMASENGTRERCIAGRRRLRRNGT